MGGKGKQPQVFVDATSNDHCGRDAEIDMELWRVCAGTQVYVPNAGEYVYYFVQGYLEQTEAYAYQETRADMPVYNVPPKVLCKVVLVELKAETGTDEVFAHVILKPTTKEEMMRDGSGSQVHVPRRPNVHFFTKKLTQSDTSTHGGFSVPKRAADDCLPALDMSKDTPSQDLKAIDLHGVKWTFRHIFRGQPRRHLLTSGWSSFVAAKKLKTGDSCIFLRGEQGQLRVGVRRTMKSESLAAATLISSQCMKHGILSGTSHALSTGTEFSVFYHPWTSPCEFLVPVAKYDRSMAINYSARPRVRMTFETDHYMDKRIVGTVLAMEDVDPIRFPNSEWRNLLVKWDSISDRSRCPHRVSPWTVEVIEDAPKKACSGQPPRQKRLRIGNASLPGSYHGQDYSTARTNAFKPPFYPHSNAIMSMQRGIMPSYWSALFGTGQVHNNVVSSTDISGPSGTSLDSSSLEQRSSESRNENESPLSQSPHHVKRIRLFGVDLGNNQPELPLQQTATCNRLERVCPVPPISQSCISETFQAPNPSDNASVIPPGKQCNDCRLIKSCTKVIKYGTALGRSVNLSQYEGYEGLVSALDQMFDFNGTLIDGSSGWQVNFIDEEGDMLLIGDQPWQEFQCGVRRMLICPKDEIDNLIPSIANPGDV